MTSLLFLVFDYLAVKFVCQGVDRCVHIIAFGGGKQICSGDMQVGLGFVTGLFHYQSHVNIRYVIDMPLQLFKFVLNVFTKAVGYIDMVSSLSIAWFFLSASGQSAWLDQPLSFIGRGNMQLLPVLGDRAAGDDDALVFQERAELVVAQWLFNILSLHQLADQGFDCSR